MRVKASKDGREEHRQDDAEGNGREHRDPRHARSGSSLWAAGSERPGLHAADHSGAAVDQSHAGADRRGAAGRRDGARICIRSSPGRAGRSWRWSVCACHALSLDPRPVGRTAVGDPNAVGGDGDGGMDPREVRVSEADVCRAASSIGPCLVPGRTRAPRLGQIPPRAEGSAARTMTRLDLSGSASGSYRQHGAVDEGAFADDLCARKRLARNVYGVVDMSTSERSRRRAMSWRWSRRSATPRSPRAAAGRRSRPQSSAGAWGDARSSVRAACGLVHRAVDNRHGWGEAF